MITGQALSELLTWEPRDLATAWEYIDDRNDAIKDAQRKGR